MKFISTRGKAPALGFSEALQAGLAPDGGLYVPEVFPKFADGDVADNLPLSAIAEKILTPFISGDPLADALHDICSKALNFPVPLETIDKETALLELFHGPTAAFKDVGARFLAECITRIKPSSDLPRTVMVATSGDTGGAVAAAFFGKPGTEVFILFPKGKISPRQEKQLTAWGGNIRAFAVQGDFDDCQRLVKEAFLNPEWKKRRSLISANSINIGRILPQTVYYAASSLTYRKRTGQEPGFVIPTGNLGNALAALWAKKMGFPVRSVTLALNANRSVLEYFETGKWTPRPTVTTLANAMDVGNPSNMERLIQLYPSFDLLKKEVSVFSATDAEISETIRRCRKTWGRFVCPHTATAAFARTELGEPHQIVVSTAHAAKFESIVEPLVGETIEVPKALQTLLTKPSVFKEIKPVLSSLEAAI